MIGKKIYICVDPECLLHSHPRKGGPAIFVDDKQVPLSKYQSFLVELSADIEASMETFSETTRNT